MNKKRQLLISFSLLLATANAAQAQSMEGTMEGMSSEDSLLPPEVVPFDPSVANSMTASQAQSRQSNMTGSADMSAPGLVGNQPAQSAQDIRKQAFESLYAQGGQNQMPQSGQWRAGNPLQRPGNAPGNVPGMQGMPGQPYAPMMANNQQQQQGYAAQSQTLTGAPKAQPQQRSTRRAGFSNVLNYATAFGAGAIMSGFLIRPNNALLGSGMYGLSMTGLGVRNSSRF